MNGKLVMMLILTAILLASGSPVIAQDGVESLRGMTAIDEESPDPVSKRWEPDREPVTRNFIQQPPLIPHSTKGYAINLKFNKCLTCHSWANYEEARATKISQEHFKDREGNELANVSASRYFCTQCHVEQRDVTPLVENQFEGVDILQ
jgi:cytochrome c-type protein NapB